MPKDAESDHHRDFNTEFFNRNGRKRKGSFRAKICENDRQPGASSVPQSATACLSLPTSGRRDAKQRIAHLLCELAARLKAAGLNDGLVFDFPITQEQLADATGLTPVHTNRTIQALRKEGLISWTSGTLTIIDWDALAQAGDFSERYLHHAAE